MTRKYKIPRNFKSDETYQNFINGSRKGGSSKHKIFSPESKQRQIDGCRNGGLKGSKTRWKNKELTIAEEKENYKI